VIVGLVLVGIGGTIYKVISPDGWVARAFGRSLSAGPASLGSLIMIAGLAWFFARLELAPLPQPLFRLLVLSLRENHASPAIMISEPSEAAPADRLRPKARARPSRRAR